MDVSEKALCLALFTGLVMRLGPTLSVNPANGIPMLSDGLVLAFILVRRGSSSPLRPLGWALALSATLLPLLIRPGGTALVAPGLAGAIGLSGLTLSIWSKLTLRRSFGLAPANRGIVHGGPYRMVRHPMYLGYVLTEIGFLLNNPNGWNISIFVLALGCQMVRIQSEEAVLRLDSAYADILKRVRYRLLPGLF
jgi:hypothetical protein